ncbi:MAG: AraC family transcriptional regulator [Nostoc sp.]|uniref:AraC family transcriptional regulator n=1 Tax=Nostoc sp. TaxID=1180 RepID=UPI002FF8469A
MTITISSQAYLDLWNSANETPQYLDSSDLLDVTWRQPSELGEGYLREIELRDGLWLAIAHNQFHDEIITLGCDRAHSLEYYFYLTGGVLSGSTPTLAGQYGFYGSGMAPGGKYQLLGQEHLTVNVHISPEFLCSFASNPDRELPPELQHLIRPYTQTYYHHIGTTTSTMQVVLHQILECPYWGISKRLHWESKVLELLGMLVVQEVEMRDENHPFHSLKTDVRERLHHARELLLQRLDNPPTLIELARLVGLNDCTLKRGFREVFGTTVFSYVRSHRLEQARQLLQIGDMNIKEIAHLVGYADPKSFAIAFRKQFGLNPKDYRKKRKYSV